MYAKTNTEDNSETTETSALTRLHYSLLGGAMIIGTSQKFRVDSAELKADMRMKCLNGNEVICPTKIKIQSHWFQSINFEPMEGVFTNCAKYNNALPDCVSNIAQNRRHFIGNMQVVRKDFVQCFSGDKGNIANR